MDLQLGNIFRYFGVAFILLAAATVTLMISWVVSLFLLIPAIMLFFVKSGIEVDSANLKFRKYDVLFGKKMGRWNTFSAADSAFLKRTNVAQNMNSRGTSVTTNVKTFDVVLKSGDVLTEIHEFKNYQQALLLFNFLKNSCGLSSKNFMEERVGI